MELINKFDLVNKTFETVAIFDSEYTRKLRELGGNPEVDMLKIQSNVPKTKGSEALEEAAHEDLMHCVSEGFMFSEFMTRDVDTEYYVSMVTAGGSRKAISDWLNKSYQNDMHTWAMCGLDDKDLVLAVNKFMAYVGLLASASKRWDEVFGGHINIRRVAIVKDFEINVEKMAVVIAKERKLNIAEARQVTINAFDGMGIVRASLTHGESVTIRGPWIKAFVQAVSWRELIIYLKENNIRLKFSDLWGNNLFLENVDMILTESCFKAAKLYKSWDQYCTAFEELGHQICVCIREHKPHMKGMPYQQGQTLLGNDEDVEKFAQHSLKTITKYEDPTEAVKLLTKWQRKVAEIYPALMNEKHTDRTIQEKIASKKNDMRGGRIPELGYNAFIAADVVALVQWIFGQEVTGYLKDGECFCSNCAADEVDITRNPHMDMAHVLLNNVEKMPLAIGTTMFINIFDFTTLKLRCDYDGDHVWYSQNADLLDLVHRTYDALGDVTFDWVAPKAKKVQVTKKEISNFVSNLLHGSEIGLYADALTKMWNTGYNFDICGWLTFGANVIIDAAKHGEVDKKVMMILRDIMKEMSDVSLPEFCRFAKADEEHPSDDLEYWTAPRVTKSGKVLPPRTAYTESFLDKYSRRVAEIVPDTLKVEGLDDLVFDAQMLLINPNRKIGRLSGLSRKARSFDRETFTYEDGGLFQRIAFRHADEWKALHNQENFIMNKDEWEAAKKNGAIKEMIDWARAQYADKPEVQAMSDEIIFETVYDIVTRNVFNTMNTSDAYDTAVKNAYWMIFGEKAYETVCLHIGEKVCKADFEDVDE